MVFFVFSSSFSVPIDFLFMIRKRNLSELVISVNQSSLKAQLVKWVDLQFFISRLMKTSDSPTLHLEWKALIDWLCKTILILTKFVFWSWARVLYWHENYCSKKAKTIVLNDFFLQQNLDWSKIRYEMAMGTKRASKWVCWCILVWSIKQSMEWLSVRSMCHKFVPSLRQNTFYISLSHSTVVEAYPFRFVKLFPGFKTKKRNRNFANIKRESITFNHSKEKTFKKLFGSDRNSSWEWFIKTSRITRAKAALSVLILCFSVCFSSEQLG